MAGSVNKVILIGNVGRDPEMRRTQDGKPIASLNVATSESWKDRNSGERREKTEWHRVSVLSEPTAKFCEQYVRKGAKVYVEGQLQTRKWQDQQGQDRFTTEIVVSGFNGQVTLIDAPEARSEKPDEQPRGGRRPMADGGSFDKPFTDEIPF